MVIEIIIGKATTTIFNSLVKWAKFKWNLHRLEENLKDELELLGRLNYLKVNEYVLKLLKLANKKELENSKKIEELIENKFKNLFESEHLVKSISDMKNALKIDSPTLQLYALKKTFTYKFFEDLFNPENPTENDIEIVRMIGRIIKSAFLKFIDIDNVIMDIWLQIEELKKSNKKGPYSIDQYEEYKELWGQLLDLQIAADELWDVIDYETLGRFQELYRELDYEVSKNAILIELNHYKELRDLLQKFKFYEIGKDVLLKEMEKKKKKDKEHVYIEIVFSDAIHNPTEKEKELIEKNKQFKKRYEDSLSKVMDDFRNHIREFK